MARRLSSLFGLSKENQHDLPHTTSSPHLRAESNSPPLLAETDADAMVRLARGSTTRAPTLLELTDSNNALPLPPKVTDMGVRPVSRNGRPESRGSNGYRATSSSRPTTPTLLTVPGAPGSPSNTQLANGSPVGQKVIKKRKSWLTSTKSEPTSQAYGSEEPTSNHAWIAGLKEHFKYDMGPLLRGEKVEELWDANADVVVHLFPEHARKNPSFRVSSALFADSKTLRYLHQPDTPEVNGGTPHISLQLDTKMANMSLDRGNGVNYRHSNVPNFSTPQLVGSGHGMQQEKHIYLPIELEADYTLPNAYPKNDDVELLVLYRNFFAFLNGGALISTPRQNSLYSILMGISSILRRLQYGNEKGSSWGVVPWTSFSRYTEELRLADVRQSREKNIEAILLGEAMRSWPLYNEGFVHAVGRLSDIKSIKSPKFDRISPLTINRLERANLDLETRLGLLKVKLDNFDFPSMFSGIANSQTATEAKLIRFKAWRLAFMDFRTFIMTQYKKKYGSWPPKAKSKKNNFEESGLNRMLLREVYQDFTDLYDLLVDRTSLTNRTADTGMPSLSDDASSGSNETIQHAIRTVESEYDRSTPPVNPPIPFDVPLLPALANSFDREHALAKKDAQHARKLRDNEINALLLGSYNRESMKPTSMCQDFLSFERKLGTGKTLQELVDLRCGQWLFIYAVLQAMPMTVVDARDLKFTEGCEYFMCMAPRGGRPWMNEDDSTSRAWYNVASGGGMISLPADLIDHSVEGIYRRSHCWQIATKWAEAIPQTPLYNSTMSFPPIAQPTFPSNSPYLEASTVAPDHPSPRGSPMMMPRKESVSEVTSLPLPMTHSRVSSRSSMNIGLQEVAAPTQQSSRQANNYNPNITFDNILGAGGSRGSDKKNKKKK